MKYNRLALVLAAALGTAAAPAAAQTVTINDISVTISDGVAISVPTITVTGSNLDEAALHNLFADGIDAAAATIATMDAASIVIPELTMIASVTPSTPGAQPVTATTTYRGFELTGLEDGVAAATRLASIESQSSDGTVFSTGEMSTGLFDLGGIFGFYGFGSAGDDSMRPVYRDFLLRDTKLSGPGFECSVGDATGAEFSSRPLKTSFADLMSIAGELEAAETAGTPPSPEAITTFINYYVDLFTAFQSTPTVVAGLGCNATDDKGKPVTISTGPITIGGFQPGFYPELIVDDFLLNVDGEGHFNLGNFTWKPMDFAPTIAALEKVEGNVELSWLEANWRKLIPAIDGFSLSGLDFDVPGDAGQRVIGSIGNFDLSLADYINGIPGSISTIASDVIVPLPESGEGSELRAFGIDILDLDSEVALHWDRTAQSIVVDNLELAGTGMGRLSISGIIGNATPELFSEFAGVQTVAAMRLTVREVTIEVENQGLAPTLIAMMAAEQKMNPAEFHIALAGMAQALPLGILGATPEAMGLSQALGGFLSGAPQLTVTLTSVNPQGISLPEFMAAQENPALLKDKVTIAAAVAGEPVPYEWPEAAAPAPDAPRLQPDDKTNG